MVAASASPWSWAFWPSPVKQEIPSCKAFLNHNSPVFHHGFWASFSWCCLSNHQNHDCQTEEDTLPVLSQEKVTPLIRQKLKIISSLPKKMNIWLENLLIVITEKIVKATKRVPSFLLVQLNWGMGLYWSVYKLRSGAGPPLPRAYNNIWPHFKGWVVCKPWSECSTRLANG